MVFITGLSNNIFKNSYLFSNTLTYNFFNVNQMGSFFFLAGCDGSLANFIKIILYPSGLDHPVYMNNFIKLNQSPPIVYFFNIQY